MAKVVVRDARNCLNSGIEKENSGFPFLRLFVYACAAWYAFVGRRTKPSAAAHFIMFCFMNGENQRPRYMLFMPCQVTAAKCVLYALKRRSPRHAIRYSAKTLE